MARRVGVLFLLAAVCLASGPARAVEASEVEELIHKGVELRQAGQDGRALPLFQKAYEISRTPRTAGQLGLCELALGYWTDADTHLGEAVASSGNPWVEKNRDALSGALARARENVGIVSVMGGPPGAKVFLDDREVGALPLDQPLRLNKGPHDVEVRAPGPVTRTKTMMVRGGDEQTVTLALETKPAAELATPPLPLVSKPAEPPRGPSGHRTLAWATGGAAAAALVFAGLETALWASNVHKFDDHTSPTNPGVNDCGSDDPHYGGAGCEGIHDDLARARLLAMVGYGAAAILGATSYLLFATPADAPPKTTALASCAPDLVERGFSCRLSF
ncbi:MAG TPA: PEGA domain-containing protein [Acidimicrobiales bacterium]|nr:PEGA domain-containing protein [Acidimicrobiales bacterium]